MLWTASSGAGPPLVLCHGGPGGYDHLEPVARLVDDLVTVHRFDQRGGGRSTKEQPWAIAALVSDMETLRTRFGYERWMVGGHSWGAPRVAQWTVSLIAFFRAREKTLSLAPPESTARM